MLMSPGVQVNEIDLSIIVPALGNATAAFAGVFTKGPSNKYLLITNAEELITNYGHPTNDNYNDWFQCYNFLNYANKLLVSRAIDTQGNLNIVVDETDDSYATAAADATTGDTTATLSTLADIKIGEIITFGNESLDGYRVKEIDVDNKILTFTEPLSKDVIEGTIVYRKVQSLNALTTVACEGEAEATESELRMQTVLIPNEDVFEVKEQTFSEDLTVPSTQKIKFIAKSPGDFMNDVEVIIAREADFELGLSYAFAGMPLNNLFEVYPREANEEIALVIRKDGEIDLAMVVSLKEGAKDYRNKSIFIEDILFKYSSYLYAKVNTLGAMPESRLYRSVQKGALDTDPNIVVENKPGQTLKFGDDGMINAGDIEIAYGSVSENTIFGNKEELDVDIVIANENARVAAGFLAAERADCICFIGASYDEVVGLPAAKIVENLNRAVLTGDLNSSSIANSFNAFFGKNTIKSFAA